jgi:hypothetical protein
MAASIPVLRILFRDLQITARRYYISHDTERTKSSRPVRRSMTTTTIIATNASSSQQRTCPSDADDMSEKGILKDAQSGILLTNVVAVDYQEKSDDDSMRYGAETV